MCSSNRDFKDTVYPFFESIITIRFVHSSNPLFDFKDTVRGLSIGPNVLRFTVYDFKDTVCSSSSSSSSNNDDDNDNNIDSNNDNDNANNNNNNKYCMIASHRVASRGLRFTVCDCRLVHFESDTLFLERRLHCCFSYFSHSSRGISKQYPPTVFLEPLNLSEMPVWLLFV